MIASDTSECDLAPHVSVPSVDNDMFGLWPISDLHSPIVVGVQRSGSVPLSRKGKRMAQSTAASGLLARALATTYGKFETDGWALAKAASGQPLLLGTGTPAVSLSHSDEWIACAAARTGRLGVDIERIRARNWGHDDDVIFHPIEAAWIRAAGDSERDARRYLCWTRKEALLKALGVGWSVASKDLGFSPQGVLIEAPDLLGCDKFEWRTGSWLFGRSAVLTLAWAQDRNSGVSTELRNIGLHVQAAPLQATPLPIFGLLH